MDTLGFKAEIDITKFEARVSKMEQDIKRMSSSGTDEIDNKTLLYVARRLSKEAPDVFTKYIDKPALSDISELQDIIHFLESEEGLYETFFFLPFSERNEFVFLAIAVITLLYDPGYLRGHKNLLVRGLRDQLAAIFDLKPNSISAKLSAIKIQLEIYPFFSKRVYGLASEYLKTSKSKKCV